MGTKILITKVKPIEYDEKYEKEAIRLKESMENNTFIFNLLLAEYEKISFVSPEKKSMYIKSINELKETLASKAHNYIPLVMEDMEKTNGEFTELSFLKILLIHNLDAINSYQTELNGSQQTEGYANLIYSILAHIYYNEKKTPEKLIDFIFDLPSEEKNKILAWLNEKKRFDLINHLLKEQYQVLIQADDEETEHDPFLKQNLDKIINISDRRNISICSQNPYEIKEIELPNLSKKELDKLCVEFLSTIDPSLKWLDIYERLKKERKIIYGKKILGEKIDWCCIMINDEIEIVAPLEGTIRDFIYLIHEFSHYISLSSLQDAEFMPPSLKEFSPLFFEMYASLLLLQKGYSKEAIEYLFTERNLSIQDNMIDINQTLRYLSQVINSGPLTMEKELERQILVIEETHDISPKHIKSLTAIAESEIKKNIDQENSFLLKYPYCPVQAYPYVIGKYLANKAIEISQEDPSIISTILEITENITRENIETVVHKLGLTFNEYEPPNKTPQYKKQN